MPRQLQSPTSDLFQCDFQYSDSLLRMSLAPSTNGKQPLQLQVALNECAFWDCASGKLSLNPGSGHCSTAPAPSVFPPHLAHMAACKALSDAVPSIACPDPMVGKF